MQKNTKIKYNGGAAMMVLVFFFVFISLTILMGIVTPTVREYKIASDSFKSKQSYFLAESGVEDVLYRLKNGKQTSSTENLVLGSSQATTTVTDIGGGQKQISTLGDTNSRQRQIDITLNTATGVSFNYGVLVGLGGVTLDGSGIIYGNVYANGPIIGDSSSYITGTAISATSPDIVADQTNGIEGLIKGEGLYNQLRVGTVSGTAQAHNVNSVNAKGNIYCQVGIDNNKACISQPDPSYISFPVSEANIEQWETDATSGGTYIGNYSVGQAGDTLGPKIIAGNLSVSGGGTLTVSGTLWVKGNLTLSGQSLIKLSSNYGANDGVIVVDGTVSVVGGGHATGSGTAGSYIMFLSKSNSTSAIKISGGAGAVIAYAPNGFIRVSGGAALKEATGYGLVVEGGSSITYESGLTNNNFSSGPSGTWNVESWKESE